MFMMLKGGGGGERERDRESFEISRKLKDSVIAGQHAIGHA